MVLDDPSATEAERAAQAVRRDIVSGALPPSSRLRLRALTERYGIGATPLREALSRLTAEGLVLAEGQRGFAVPPVTRAHLADLTFTRQLVEGEAVRQAIAAGGPSWEDGIVTAFHLLRREVERTTDFDQVEPRHHRFHASLLAACPYPTLLEVCDALYLQGTRYRQVLRHRWHDVAVTVQAHQALMEVVLARDPEGAALMLGRHIGTTADELLPLL